MTIMGKMYKLAAMPMNDFLIDGEDYDLEDDHV